MSAVILMIVFLAAIAGSGMVMWFLATFQSRIQRLEHGGGGEQMAQHIEALRQELLATREDIGELYERLEFTERLLTRGKDEEPS